MGRFITLICLSALTLSRGLAQNPEEQDRALQYLERAKILYERSEYDSLPWYYSHSNTIFNRLNKYALSAECILGMVDYHRMLNRQSAATSMLDSAERYIIRNLGRESESWADALYYRAKLFYTQSRQRESVNLLNSCIELQRRLDMPIDKMARVYNVLGAVHYTLGDLEMAEVNYQKAFETYMEISAEPTVEKGILLFNIGLVYGQRKDQHKWAAYTIRGIENNILLFGPDFPDLAGYYNTLSSYYIMSGKLDSAMVYIDRAETIMLKAFGNEYHNLSKIYINRARIYKYEGDYQASLDYYLQALHILEKQEILNWSLTNIVYINIASLYSARGDYRTAYDYLIKLLEAEGIVHPSRMATFYSYLAEIMTKLEEYDDAEKYIYRVFDIRDKIHPGIDSGLAFDYIVCGTLMDSTNRHSQAGQFFRKALEITRNNYGEHHYRTARVHKILGDHYAAIRQYDSALYQFQMALHSFYPEYDVMSLEQNVDPGMASDLLFYLMILKQKGAVLESLARISATDEQRKTYINAAFSAYNSSVQVIEMLRTSYMNDESKLYLSENERITYEKGVQTAFRSYELSSDPAYLTEAYRIAEKGKYATLQSVLHREEVLNLSGIPDTLRVFESELKKQLSVYQELLMERQNDTLPDQVELQQYRNEVFRLKDQITGLHRSFETDHPDYYELLYNQQVLDPAILAKSLRRKEKVIEFFIAGRELYIFEISHEGFACTRDLMDGNFLLDLDLVERYIGGNSIRDTIQDDHLKFIESAYRLHSRLLPSSDGFRDLIIIPEGVLSYFPFDVLITEPVSKFSGLFKDVPFLIRNHTVRYGYSATLLGKRDRRYPGSLKRFIGFAPGYATSQEELAGTDIPREMRIDRASLDALPGSIDEVQEIGNLLGGEAYTGANASEGKFKSLAGESHIIHLATHTFLDDDDPLMSTLVFSENRLEEEDGFLNIYELYNMDLKARMVVLSACNSGTGELKSGEGIMSLARAFFYAGVPNIVMTLWTVTDRQSYHLMLSFYKQLSKGRRAESALRKAKLEYLENALPGYQHPRYWSGYILIGNPENLFLSHFYRQLLVASGILLALLAGFIMLRKYSGIKWTRD